MFRPGEKLFSPGLPIDSSPRLTEEGGQPRPLLSTLQSFLSISVKDRFYPEVAGDAPMKRRIVAIAALLLVVSAIGQVRLDKPPGSAGRQRKPSKGPAEFTFVRTIYNSPFRGWRGSWATDFPEADYHFVLGVRYWSGANLDISEKPLQMQIMDEKLFELSADLLCRAGLHGACGRRSPAAA